MEANAAEGGHEARKAAHGHRKPVDRTSPRRKPCVLELAWIRVVAHDVQTVPEYNIGDLAIRAPGPRPGAGPQAEGRACPPRWIVQPQIAGMPGFPIGWNASLFFIQDLA
jgi:hypothetical protein